MVFLVIFTCRTQLINMVGDHFLYRIIETCPSSELIAREQSYLDILFNNFPKELVYNFCAVAYSTLGYTHTAEAKALISAALSGRTFSDKTKALMSERQSGENNGFFGKT